MPTTQIPRDFSEFLKSLIAHDVKFLLIGGYAVAAFGFVRTTGDIDVWIGGDADNQNRVVRAVRAFGFASTPDNILEEPNAMLRMGVTPLRIEILKSISGVEFEIEDLKIPTISLDDLKRNKLASGRAKDLADVEELSRN